VSLVSDAANAVGDGASDGVSAAGDEWDNANDALSDPGGWAEGQASDAWDSFEDAGSDLFDPLADALGGPLDEIIDLDDVVGVIERAAKTTPDLVVDAASAALASIPEQYSESLSRVIEVWDELLVDVDRMIQNIVDDVMRAATALEEIFQATMTRLTAAIDQTAQLVELVPKMLERLLYFLEKVVRCIVDLLAMLGGCAGGVVGYYLWKSTVVTANLYKPVRQIPKKLQEFLDPVFPEFRSYQNAWVGWHNIYLVEDAWIRTPLGTEPLGTAFVDVTFYGVRLSSVVYVKDKLDLHEYWKVSNVMHELEHVRQMTRFVSEMAFACAYGAGLALRLGYNQNPFERAAFALECRQKSRILAWVGPGSAYDYEDPCLKIHRHNPCSTGFH
jgi:hypothetical protein